MDVQLKFFRRREEEKKRENPFLDTTTPSPHPETNLTIFRPLFRGKVTFGKQKFKDPIKRPNDSASANTTFQKINGNPENVKICYIMKRVFCQIVVGKLYFPQCFLSFIHGFRRLAK